MVRSLVEWVKGRGREGGKGDGGEVKPYGRETRARGVKGTACNRDRVIGLQVAALVGHGTEALGAHGPS